MFASDIGRCGRRPNIMAKYTTVLLSVSLGAFASQQGDLVAGMRSYAKCLACHSPEYNRTGPLHCGLLGRKAGSVKGYAYTNAMRGSGITWDVDTLNTFLSAPLEMVPGTSMGFAGISDDTERRNLIAWLATLDASADACRDLSPTQRESKR